jgi:hypothetical protein
MREDIRFSLIRATNSKKMITFIKIVRKIAVVSPL